MGPSASSDCWPCAAAFSSRPASRPWFCGASAERGSGFCGLQVFVSPRGHYQGLRARAGRGP
eukprot:7250359-Lingulodinium_polyedra.AAC.1